MSRGYITIHNGEAGKPLAVLREGSRTEISPGRGAVFSVPDGFCISVTPESSHSRGRHRKLLRIWQAAAFMAVAALLLSLIACTGKATRADVRAWSGYSKATGQIMQNQEGK